MADGEEDHITVDGQRIAYGHVSQLPTRYFETYFADGDTIVSFGEHAINLGAGAFSQALGKLLARAPELLALLDMDDDPDRPLPGPPSANEYVFVQRRYPRWVVERIAAIKAELEMEMPF